jgi:hypothetical protein
LIGPCHRPWFSGIEKSENDDKLISMLKDEIKRIESIKGVKGTLQTGNKMELVKPTDELI